MIIVKEDIETVFSQKINDIYNIYLALKGKKFSKIESLKNFFNSEFSENIDFIFENKENLEKLINGFMNLLNFIKKSDNENLKSLYETFDKYKNILERVLDVYDDIKEYHSESPEAWKEVIKNRSPKLDESIDKIRKLMEELEYYNKIKTIQEKLYGKKVDKWTRFFSENTIRKYIKTNGKNLLSESLDKDDYQKIKDDPELKNWLELKKMWNNGQLSDRQKEKIKKAEKMLDAWGDTSEYLDRLKDNVLKILDDVFNEE